MMAGITGEAWTLLDSPKNMRGSYVPFSLCPCNLKVEESHCLFSFHKNALKPLI